MGQSLLALPAYRLLRDPQMGPLPKNGRGRQTPSGEAFNERSRHFPSLNSENLGRGPRGRALNTLAELEYQKLNIPNAFAASGGVLSPKGNNR